MPPEVLQAHAELEAIRRRSSDRFAPSPIRRELLGHPLYVPPELAYRATIFRIDGGEREVVADVRSREHLSSDVNSDFTGIVASSRILTSRNPARDRFLPAAHFSQNEPVVVGGVEVPQPGNSLVRQHRSGYLTPLSVGVLPPGRYQVCVEAGDQSSIAPTLTGQESRIRICGEFRVHELVQCDGDYSMTIVPTQSFSVPALAGVPDLGDTITLDVALWVPRQGGQEVVGPLVVFTHGEPSSDPEHHLKYSGLFSCLAANGFIVASVHSMPGEGALLGDPPRRAKFLVLGAFFAHAWLQYTYGLKLWDLPAGSPRLAFAGHSRGGEAARWAARRWRREVAQAGKAPAGLEQVGAVIALAPADNRKDPPSAADADEYEDPESPIQDDLRGYLQIMGTLDEDSTLAKGVTEYEQTRFSKALFYPHPVYKGLLMVDGATHLGFTGPPDPGPPNLGKFNLDPQDAPDILQHRTLRRVAQHYCVSFLDWKLRGEVHNVAWFSGHATPVFGPQEIAPADVDKLRLRLLFFDWPQAGWYFDDDAIVAQGFDFAAPTFPLGQHGSLGDGRSNVFPGWDLEWSQPGAIVQFEVNHLGSGLWWSAGMGLSLRFDAARLRSAMGGGNSKLSTEPAWLEVKLWAKGANTPFGTIPAIAVPAIDDFITNGIAEEILSTVSVDLDALVEDPPLGEVEIVRIDLVFTSASARVLLALPRFGTSA